MVRTFMLSELAASASGLCALISAIEVIEAGGPLDGDLFEWFADRLRTIDPDWPFFVRAEALDGILARLVRLFARQPDAIARCEQLYESLEPSRRRAEYGRRYSENDAELASILALAVLCSLITELATTAEGKAACRRSAYRALGWAHRLVLTAAPAFPSTLSVEQALVLAVVTCSRVDPDGWMHIVNGVLSDPAVAARVIAALLAVRSTEEVEGALALSGQTIQETLRRAEEWAMATERPDDHAAVKSLGSALSETARPTTVQ